MALRRFLARQALAGVRRFHADNFLSRAGLTLHIPAVPGALGVASLNGFSARKLMRPMDLLVGFGMGDWAEGARGSSYFDRESPWYNVFYGGYGVRSWKPDGSAWGYDQNGEPVIAELSEVVRLDYNFLTAGELGCPPARMCFRELELGLGREGEWDYVDARVQIPSARHRLRDAVRPNPGYYVAFGFPPRLAEGEESFEPVRMRGRLYFRKAEERITLAWGALCPDTEAGQRLRASLMEALAPHYLGSGSGAQVMDRAA